MRGARVAARLAASVGAAVVLAGCGGAPAPDQEATGAEPGSGFDSADCNGVRTADIERVVGSNLFKQAVIGDAGCFWQENTMIGSVGAGMGISTWWYRGSDMATERELEALAGREVTELAMEGNDGFMAFDDTACSIYVAKGDDVITWSIQTMNSATLPDLCGIVDELAQLSQDRVN